MRVFEQRTGTHGNRRLDGIEKGEEVGYQRIGQLCAHKMLQNLLVRCIAQGYRPEVVLVHELVEEVGTQHHGLWNLHRCILKLVQFRMSLDDVVKECQATALTTQRALTDTGKVGIAVELQAVEHSHDTDILHPSVLHNGVEDNLAVGIQVLQLVPRHRLQELADGEDGARTKPAAHVVAAHVVLERVGRNVEDVVLQLLQRVDTRHLLLRLRVTEHEVTKAHVLLNQRTQVHIHLLRILVDEVEPLGLCLLLVLNLRTLQNQRHILVTTTNLAQQLQASLSITLLHVRQSALVRLHRESRIADDAQHIVMIALIPLHRLGIVRGQHHLRTSTLALSGSMGVQCLRREVLRLCQDIVVEVRQHARIEADIVLHQQNHLHASFRHVVLDIHLVLNQFDNRQDEVRIAQPAEHIVESRHVLVLNALGDTV